MRRTHTKPLDLTPEVDALGRSSTSAEALIKAIVALFYEKLAGYNWVGFYMLEKDAGDDVLVLGPFKGAATRPTRIPLNQGICGAAASVGKTIVVDDVNAGPRYLACSLETRSEIVFRSLQTSSILPNSGSLPSGRFRLGNRSGGRRRIGALHALRIHRRYHVLTR